MTPSEARRRKLKAQTPENLAKIDNALIEAFVAKNNLFALKKLFYIVKMKINIKKLTTTAKIPTRGSEYAAGYDLYADITKDLVIEPHETAKIGTGLSIEIPDGYFGAVFARSGLAAKQALRPANCVGVCDSDYRGEYIVALHNDGTQARTINPGDRIAQLVVMPYLAVEFNEVSELSDTKRGAGGFGSTGAN